jgi:hypothetical protein
MTYTLLEFPGTVRRDADGAFIPFDESNADYQDYLAWLDEGNEPNNYVPPSTPFIETVPVEARLDDLEERVAALEGGP